MKVAIMYSGGKDSTYALWHAIKEKWDIKALISVKPKDTEAYLYHYATVEHTPLIAKAVGIPHILLNCNVNGPKEEASILEPVFSKLDIDAVLLGGVGLQKTQIREIGLTAERFGIRAIVPHRGMDHLELFKEIINSGFDVRITQVASYGLGPEWLGRKINIDALTELKILSEQYGFHIGFEGGYADTFVCDAPFYSRKIEFGETKKVWDPTTYSGYLVVKNAKLVPKAPMIGKRMQS